MEGHGDVGQVGHVPHFSAFHFYCGTKLNKQAQRSSNWQAHMVRISQYTYVELSPGVWWRMEDDNFIFHDGDGDLNCRAAGPSLIYFRSSTLESVAK